MKFVVSSVDRKRMQTLSEFRYAIRQFLQFSEQRAIDAGLHPQQHQLLLHLAGSQEGAQTTVSFAAERLGLRHHSVVELSKRCEEAGLIRREQSEEDRRVVVLTLTAEGQQIIRSLSEDHERELSVHLPALMRSLSEIKRRGGKRVTTPAKVEGQ
jgi:DNA-binding MarR family transcriptional regulator